MRGESADVFGDGRLRISGSPARDQSRDVMVSPRPRKKSDGVRDAVVVACGSCGQRWLVAGLGRGEMYACRSCGHRFPAGPDDPRT